MQLNAALRLRADRDVYAKQRTPDEVKALPEFRMAYADSEYRITDTAYVDNKDGLGATPDNQNVRYKGFVSVIPITTFLKLCLPSNDAKERGMNLAQLMYAGYGIGSPCLYVDIAKYLDGSGPVVVTGHEGRARANVLMNTFKVKEIPIQFFPEGYRARHLGSAEDLLHSLNAGIVTETGATLKNAFKAVLLA